MKNLRITIEINLSKLNYTLAPDNSSGQNSTNDFIIPFKDDFRRKKLDI